MSTSGIDDTRRAIFQHLAGTATELRAVYLKADGQSPSTVARLNEDRVQLLLTASQWAQVREHLERADGTRPNLHAQLSRWFLDEDSGIRYAPAARQRGNWVSATAAACVYRFLYSNRDYSGDNRGGASINGWTEWGFGDAKDGEHVKLVVSGSDVQPFEEWLANPVGEAPFIRSKAQNVSSNGGGTVASLSVGQRAALLARLTAPEVLPTSEIQRQLDAFERRFPKDRWRSLYGRELLREMHGRDTNDSLVYWLEFKNDDVFETRRFGSISGGSSLKFTVYWSKSEGAWRTGSSKKMVNISEEEAAKVAESQRDEFLAALGLLDAVGTGASVERYEQLQRDIEAAAPQFHHLAFFHKLLYLYGADRLDDYHSTRVQQHVTCQLGLVLPATPGLFAGAGPLIATLRDLRRDAPDMVMNHLTLALNQQFGPPVSHWRVGTGEGGELWPHFDAGGFAAVGWQELGDLADIVGGATGNDAVVALKAAIAQQWPDKSKQQVGKDARQLWHFMGGINEGDRVYAASGMTVRGVGVVTGPYRFEDDGGWWASRRPVRWLTNEPFKSPTKAGLMTTVYRLDNAHEVLAAAARHLDGASSTTAPAVDAPRQRVTLGPVGQQLERKGQVVLYGPPGTGKTYHALQVAESLVARARHRAWAELSPAARSAVKGGDDPSAQRIWVCSFHPAYGYEDFVEGLKAKPVPGGLEFVPQAGLFRRICERALAAPDEPFVLIIDEFNRGDVPRIFGELLTLLELDKRERVRVELPLSGVRFTVPRNVRIVATMNTTDRSISLLDAALRRRFGFVEYMPDPAVLGEGHVDGLSLGTLLSVLNERLVRTLGEAARNLQVGHAYFMAESRPIGSVIALKNAVRYDLYPLLEEYCADSPAALASLLGESLFDATVGRFRDELLQTGRETDFLDALTGWEPERLSRDEPDDEVILEDVDSEDA